MTTRHLFAELSEGFEALRQARQHGLGKAAHEKTLPFEMRIPNALTEETLQKSERGEDVHDFDSAEIMFRDLEI